MKSHPIIPNNPIIIFLSLDSMICLRESLRFDITRPYHRIRYSQGHRPDVLILKCFEFSKNGCQEENAQMKSIMTAHIRRAVAITIETVPAYLETNGLIAPPASSHTRLAPGPASRRRAVTGSRSMNLREYGRTNAE